MKTLRCKYYLMAFILLFVFSSTNLSAQWKTNGNSPAGTGNTLKLGTLNCNAMKIVINNQKMLEFTNNCMSSSGDNEIKFYNTDVVDFGTTSQILMGEAAEVYLPGGGVILTKGSGTAFAKGMAIGNSTVCRLGITSYQYLSEACLDIIDSPKTAKPVINVETVTPGAVNCYGIRSKAVPIGGYGYGVNAEGGRYGVYGKASGGPFGDSVVVSGLYGIATGFAGQRAGVYASSTGTGTAINFGIFAAVDSAGPNVAGYFQGDINHTGIITGPSDMKLKEEIQPYTGALQNLNKLEVKKYNYRKEYGYMNLPRGKQIGLIAQDLEKIFPELVVERVHPKGYNPETNELAGEEVHYKTVNYIGLIPVLIEALKEQQTQITLIETNNKVLSEEVSNLKDQLALLKGQSVIQLLPEKNNVLSRPLLFQNNPNPANQQTSIEYFIPPDIKNAVINIYSRENKLLKSFNIVSREKGQLLINQSQFGAGSYQYELITDGIVADSKQMILTK